MERDNEQAWIAWSKGYNEQAGARRQFKGKYCPRDRRYRRANLGAGAVRSRVLPVIEESSNDLSKSMQV